jgi:hypothetical protein
MTTQCGSIRSYGPGLLGDACVCVEDMGAAEFMRFIENYFEQDEEEGAAEEELSQVDMATDEGVERALSLAFDVEWGDEAAPKPVVNVGASVPAAPPAVQLRECAPQGVPVSAAAPSRQSAGERQPVSVRADDVDVRVSERVSDRGVSAAGVPHRTNTVGDVPHGVSGATCALEGVSAAGVTRRTNAVGGVPHGVSGAPCASYKGVSAAGVPHRTNTVGGVPHGVSGAPCALEGVSAAGVPHRTNTVGGVPHGVSGAPCAPNKSSVPGVRALQGVHELVQVEFRAMGSDEEQQVSASVEGVWVSERSPQQVGASGEGGRVSERRPEEVEARGDSGERGKSQAGEPQQCTGPQ